MAVCRGEGGKFKKMYIFFEYVVWIPECSEEEGVCNSVDGKYFQGIFCWKEAVSIKGDQKKRTDANEFPAQEQCFKISGQDDERKADEKY